ncbi:MAG: hypothetical protein IJT55_08890 [Prevotella sp.]|nr:hypothetical protein [Prevotella sp.]
MRIAHNLLLTLFSFSIACVSVACGGEEDDTTPSYADINGFAPADDDNSPTAQLRRDFYNQTGSYLLFKDTLITRTSDGRSELLDITYFIMGSIDWQSDYDYTYEYIEDIEQQRKAAEYVQKYLISRLGKNTPYSFFLVNDLHYDYYGRLRQRDKVLGLRSYVISMGGGEAYEDPETYFGDMIVDIVKNSISRVPEEVMNQFYAFSKDYYGNDVEGSLTDQEVWDLGMFYYIADDWWGNYFYYESTDLSLWLEAVLTMSPSEFEAEYGSSSVMMEKYTLLREIILNQGFEI